MAILSCSVVDCDKTGRIIRGMCVMHYQRVRKQERFEANPCATANCKNPGEPPNNFCNTHQYRLDTHGDPMVTGKGKKYKVQYNAEGLRVCNGCNIGKPATEYHADSRSFDGYRAQCKPCRSAFMKGYHTRTIDQRRDYRTNRARTHAEHIRKLDTARYERDKDKRIALASDHVRIRRARLAGTVTDAKVTVRNLRKIHGDYCCYCGIEMSFVRGKRGEGIAPNLATLEHVIPLSRGGSHTFDNTKLACHHCNVSKNRKTVDEWEQHKAWLLTGQQPPSGGECETKSEPKRESAV